MPAKARLLIVDGYNVLGAWPELSRGKKLDDARDALIDRLHDYAGYSGQQIVLATSDGTEQTVVFGRGAVRISSRELIYEMRETKQSGVRYAQPVLRAGRSTVMDRLPEDVRRQLEKLRRGET